MLTVLTTPTSNSWTLLACKLCQQCPHFVPNEWKILGIVSMVGIVSMPKVTKRMDPKGAFFSANQRQPTQPELQPIHSFHSV